MNHDNTKTSALTEQTFEEAIIALRGSKGLSVRPPNLVVTQEGIDRMKALTDADPEFRKRVIAEFPQLVNVL